MTKRDLIALFQDTQNQCRTGVLEQRTRSAVAGTRVYEPGFRTQQLLKAFQTVIRVNEGSVLGAAREHISAGKTAIVNCANPHFPGAGVVQGGVGQEEKLCRCTNLYPCLCHPRVNEGFYKLHKAQGDYDFSDRVICAPGITVFKDDRLLAQPLPQKQWMTLDVLSCAAPYQGKREYSNEKVLKAVLKKRVRNIFEAAMDQGVEILVLGAFGCGIFGNPPEIVAKAFHEVLLENRYRSSFMRVIFAIPRSDPQNPTAPCPRIAAFQNEFFGFSMENKKLGKKPEKQVPENAEELLPGGKTLQGIQAEEFRQWRRGNFWYGKQFSVLGDSISTLQGMNPPENAVYYTPAIAAAIGVKTWRDTWWGKVIEYLGGELLVNQSWSGTQVARMRERREQFPSGCSDRRTGELHVLTVKPEVILVFMGLNDWARGVIPRTNGREIPSSLDTYFCVAYDLMLQKLKKKYPKAEIWCFTLPRSYMSAREDYRFRDDFGGYPLEDYNEVIREGAKKHGCALVDLYKMVPGYDTLDGSHPNARGMDQLAAAVIRQMADLRGAGMMDCTGPHEIVENVCRRCGKVLLPGEADQPALHLRIQATGEIRKIPGKKIRVGRGRDCQLKLESPYVARSQAYFLHRDGRWYLQDDFSRNGTFLNDERLETDEEYLLEPGDRIRFARQQEMLFLG